MQCFRVREGHIGLMHLLQGKLNFACNIQYHHLSQISYLSPTKRQFNMHGV